MNETSPAMRLLLCLEEKKPTLFLDFILCAFLRACSRSTAPLPVVLGRCSKSSFTSCKLRFLRSVRTQLAAARNDLEQVLRALICLFLVGQVISCANVTVKPVDSFQLSERKYLYGITDWSFNGRLALSNSDNAVSASISWDHQTGRDEIELAGPFGQRRVNIAITENDLIVDSGETSERLQHGGNVDELVSRQLGMDVPMLALKYWVLGLVEPKTKYISLKNGFLQSGWRVEYLQMQIVESDELPRKIRVGKETAKLKLIINYWEL